MGIAISGAVLCAHTAELLLKYKLDQEGKTFKPTHDDLYELYLSLSNESKEAIQKDFDELVSQALLPPNGLPTGWDSAEAVFKSARCIFTEWRYVIEKNPKSRKSPVGSLDSLYTAVLSVLRTTTLGSAMLTRETMKGRGHTRSGYQSEGLKSHEQERDCSMNRGGGLTLVVTGNP